MSIEPSFAVDFISKKMKIKIFCVLTLLFFVSCFARSQVITREGYNDLMLGSPASELTQKFGPPYSINKVSGGGEEYEYIEKIEAGNELIYENHYFFIVVNGQVMRKREKRELRPAYDLLYQEDPNYSTYP